MTFVYRQHTRFEPSVCEDRCRASVYDNGIRRSYQCQRKPAVIRCVDGKEIGFCKQHDPEAVKARHTARAKEWERERAEARAKEQRRADTAKANAAAKAALEQIAAGHNDPRALAAEILALFPADDLPTPHRAEGA